MPNSKINTCSSLFSLRESFLILDDKHISGDNSVFFYCACVTPEGKSVPFATKIISRISESKTDGNCAGTDWKKEWKRASVRNSLNGETKGPRTSTLCTWSLSLLRDCLSLLLWIRPGCLSVENWAGVDVCTRERMTAGKEMLMTFMGNKQDIYLQVDRYTWPLGWFSYT